MMKQNKNKKGRLAKSTLSVVLAASMVMSSSSFVWASPEVQELPETAVMAITETENVGEATTVTVTVDSDEHIYNGKSQTPTLTFENGGEEVKIDSAFYDVVVKNPDESGNGIDAGTTTYTVTFKEEVNYTFEQGKSTDVTMEIKAVTLTPAMVEGILPYDGGNQTPDFTFTNQNGESLKLVKDQDYTVSADDMKNVGSNKGITLSLAGDDYGGGKNHVLDEETASSFTYDIVAKKITPIVKDDFTYNSEEQIPASVDFKGIIEGETLTADTDYTITPTPKGDYTSVGEKEVTVELNDTAKANNYEIEETDKTVTYNIVEAEITVSDERGGTYQYTGEEVLPELSFGGASLEEDDYKIIKTGKDYVTPGDKSVEVQLVGEAAKKYRLSKSTIDYTVKAAAVIAGVEHDILPYNGKSQVPELMFTNEDGYIVSLVKGKDYTTTVDYDTTSVGEKTIKVKMLNESCELANDEITYEITPVDINDATITVKKGESFVYNGKEQHPTVAEAYAWLDGKKVSLVEGVDYEIEGVTDVADEKIPVMVKGINNYAGQKDTGATFEIEPATFNKRNIDVAAMKLLYNGEAQKPDPKLSIAETGVELKLDTDYTMSVADKDSKTPGTYDVTFTAKGKNFKAGGTVEATYQIAEELTLKECLEKAIVTDGNKQTLKKNSDGVWVGTYTGDEKGFDLKVDDQNADIKENVDYTIEVPDAEDCVNAGSYSITITGKKGYAGETVTIPFQIAPKPLNGKSASDSVDKAGNVNGGLNTGISMAATLGMTHDKVRAENAAVVIKDGNKVLSAGTDYTYTTDKTTGTVCITGAGNYTTAYGEKDKVKTFTSKYALIDQLSINDPTITAEVTGTYTYTGSDIKPGADKLEIKEGSYKLQDKVDYKIVGYNKNTYAGTAEITVEGIGDYTGERVLTFTITGSTLADAYEFEAITDVTYDGKDHKAAFDSKTLPLVMLDKKTGKEVSQTVVNNVTVAYYRDGVKTTDFKSPGAITVEATAKEGTAYEGKISTTYNIVGQQIGAYANVEAIADQAYTGSAITPDVKVVSKDGKVTLVKDTDYTVSYLDNTEIGTATAVIQGIGKYAGQIVATFKITGQIEQTISVLPAQERDLQKRYMDSKATKVKFTEEPKTEVSYASSDENVVKVDAKTGAISYTGVGKATITITAAESEVYKAATKELAVVVRPVTPANVKAAGGKDIKVTASAVSKEQAPKYQIKVWKTGRKAVFINVNNTGDLSKAYTTKSSGKFNVAVRAYKTIDNVHYFSAWSPVKTATVKK